MVILEFGYRVLFINQINIHCNIPASLTNVEHKCITPDSFNSTIFKMLF